MYDSGYKPPFKPDNLILPGEDGFATIKLGLHNMRENRLISDHDKLIGTKLAYVLCGGNIRPNTPVSVEYVLDLEREAFMSLIGEKKTQDRMDYMLKNGKPLRN